VRLVLLLGIIGLLVGSGAAIYSYFPHRELPDDVDFHGEQITSARQAAVIELRDQLGAFEHRAALCSGSINGARATASSRRDRRHAGRSGGKTLDHQEV
jgi:hypothetical protein